ncbi:hypothetical protein SJI00_21010 [Pseudomonas sp. RP23018S]|uniref:hypothetical protein n=1 Tax=Pseudomonas sp. RP23018S TaxID=3096037 RepID=UPI002ACA0EB5|nr:hypothetical protein [Pseudomonas sp. RP23018S]MDZ5605257.1 hypothetical protein [Pseudomonas sp. RP23018S]
MATLGKFAVINEAELNLLRKEAARWRFFAARVAAQASTTVEAVSREVDEAIAAGHQKEVAMATSEGKNHEQ